VALEATLAALERCLAVADFHETLWLSSKPLPRVSDQPVRTVQIAPLDSRESYSEFILAGLSEHVSSDFVLIVQWDGFIVEPEAWSDDFFRFDYIGAPWLDFAPDRNVGNGGFSLRSKRLLDAGSEVWFDRAHPEDLCICHYNRERLDAAGFQFADVEAARRFSRERETKSGPHFGIHGVFALAEVMVQTDFAEMLASIEPGVIGGRELIDLVGILSSGNMKERKSLRRCAREYLRRFPFTKRTPRMMWLAL
jgi:hypothetical protein